MMDTSIVEVINVTREVAWLPWAVQYFFLIGLSVGGLLLSLPGYAFARAGWRKLGRVALLAALTCGLAAPVALLSDLHQPGRFWHFYVVFRPTSWMWWGSIIIPLYVTALLVYGWACLREELHEQGRVDSRLAALYRLAALGGGRDDRLIRTAGLVALAASLLVALYTGSEVAVVRARPLWHTPFLPVQFLATALAGAAGLVLLLNRFAADGDRDVEVRANRLLAAALGAVMLVGALWLALGLSGLEPTHAEALRSVAGSEAWRVTAVWAVAATVLPFAIAVAKPAGTGLLTGLVAVHGAWMFRWTVFIGGQTVPKTGAGFYEYALPAGPDGVLGIVGTAGLWMFLLLAVTAVLPIPRRAAPGMPHPIAAE
ncbi:NrfD/PsrC family molybdoenzyme membrane anchor subunit [Azospirillum picis]|uniref:Tetrathionate reductase subunit C n=1 Tax=Azospirillum picis TaxID=488438 RepID=A0ABU0MMA9_9PROT|nr:NrfD/PsrC family molybdoenzyme membrane anchor subunit [Azospirillum picis]MBP2300515.1 tetrathionate reductase subunit C [Azospirillum picis]MDQ0534484.1 tetrathionate reductase subunit C [Azospirillum picis]